MYQVPLCLIHVKLRNLYTYVVCYEFQDVCYRGEEIRTLISSVGINCSHQALHINFDLGTIPWVVL